MEVTSRHAIAFHQDTRNEEARELYMHDQTVVQPILLQYQGELDKKFCDCPFTPRLDDGKYGLMRRVRQTKVKLFRQENIPLIVREQEIVARYQELMGGLTVAWNGEKKPHPYVQAQLDSPDRATREKAWQALAAVRREIKPQVDEMMNELVRVRHQIATNAGFENYRDYVFAAKNREFTLEQILAYHDAIEKHAVPAADRLAQVFQAKLGVATYRPWDATNCLLPGAPFENVTELMDGVAKMLGETDPAFRATFDHMRSNGLLDLDVREGKAPGGFCMPLPRSKEVFVFANFSPSFFAVIALIHEMGHAVNFYHQFESGQRFSEYTMRMEVAELYSHGMELLNLDKLRTFYTSDEAFDNAKAAELNRAFRMLIGPMSGDVFQHWLYTHPNHTVEERDAKFLEMCRRFTHHATDITGLEADLANSWIESHHIVGLPFYNIEYSLSELGAIQLLELYRDDPANATRLFRQGAASDSNMSIADIYRATGVDFDFTEPAIRKHAAFVEQLVSELA